MMENARIMDDMLIRDKSGTVSEEIQVSLKVQECACYLKSNSGYQRPMEEMRKKWISYGRPAGKVTLVKASEEERRALESILGKSFDPGKVSFTLSEFETALQRTRFAGAALKDVLEAYFGVKLRSNREKQEAKEQRRQEFFEEWKSLLLRELGSSDEASEKDRIAAICSWIDYLRESKKNGYQYLMTAMEQNWEEALCMAIYIAKAAWILTKENGMEMTERPVSEQSASEQSEKKCRNTADASITGGLPRKKQTPLAVFASDITGNPHYFDQGTEAGILLMQAICFFKNLEMPHSSYEWRECLRQAGILTDTISSMVHALGLRLRTEAGYHPAYDWFCQLREPFVITLENLRKICTVHAIDNRVYVVENEMVFSYLVNQLQDLSVTILCTSGQLRTAAWDLMELLVRSGTEIWYNGDMDPEGMLIADRLWQRYPERVKIWRMSVSDYERSQSMEEVDKARLTQLGNLKHLGLKATADMLMLRKKAAYQEKQLGVLLADIHKAKVSTSFRSFEDENGIDFKMS